MAPLSLEQIGESLARETQAFIETNECVQSTLGTSVGSFFLGFSTGVALQVHYARFLPRRMKAIMLLPAVLGMTAATVAHKKALKQCEKEWRGQETIQLTSGTTNEVKCVKV